MITASNHLHRMDIISSYLVDLFKSKISVTEGSQAPIVIPPLAISTSMLVDCQHVTNILAEAYLRPGNKSGDDQLEHQLISNLLVTINWSANSYRDNMPPRPRGFDGPVEDELTAEFPPIFHLPYPVVEGPCILVSADGFILAWYLPNAMTPELQVCPEVDL